MSGLEQVNGHRPDGLLHMLHPLLKAAPRPDRDVFAFDLERALRSIVRLHAVVPDGAFTAAGLGTERQGSGIVIDGAGLVLTVGYLIVEASQVMLGLPGGRQIPGHAIAYDHETGFGMVRALEDMGLEPLPFGASASVHADDPVVIASFGGLGHSIGGRVVARREFAGSWEYLLDDAIFTAPMHPYWGGAALIDARGRLVGTGSLYTEETLPDRGTSPGNMFVPVDLLKPIYDDMVATGRARRPQRPWLGMYTADAGGRLIVTGVAPKGPAAQAGIEPGDAVLSLQGVAAKDLPHLYRTLWAAGDAGASVRFTLLRDDDVLTVNVRTADRYGFLDLMRRH
jgi:S1-C subfamily serine protease